MSGPSELVLRCEARPSSAKILRHALGAFLRALDIDAECSDDILTAVGEALANAIEHAYPASATPGDVELRARAEKGGVLVVSIADGGHFVDRPPRPNRGFGLKIARAIAREVSVETAGGTAVRMTFDAAHPRNQQGPS